MRTKMLLLVMTALTVAGCKKDKEDEPVPPAATTGTLNLEVGFHWAGPEFDTASTYADGAGNAIRFNALKLYLSETHLESGGSTLADFHDSFLLLDGTEEAVYTIGSSAPGSFDAIEITIGLDSAVNHADPTLAEAPLNDPSMHWAWNPAAGYKFLLLEGRVDDDGTGIVDADDPSFTYHCATDDALRVFTASHSAAITAGQSTTLHMEVNVDQIVVGVNMLTAPMGMGYEPVNVQLMDNLAGALEIE